MTKEEALKILGIENQNPTSEEIEFSYKFKARAVHPDRFLSPEMKKRAETEMKAVNAAHLFLTENYKKADNPPKLRVTPQNIRFKEMAFGQKKITSIEIENLGGPYTRLVIDDPEVSWLKIHSDGPVSALNLPAQITIEATGINQQGSEGASYIRIKLLNKTTGAFDEASVIIEVTGVPINQPILQVDQTYIRVELDSNEAYTTNLLVENTGGGILMGSLTSNKPWLKVSPETMEFDRSQSPKNIRVFVVPAKIPKPKISDYVGTINIETNGGSDRVTVAVNQNERIQHKKPINKHLVAIMAITAIILIPLIFLARIVNNSGPSIGQVPSTTHQSAELNFDVTGLTPSNRSTYYIQTENGVEIESGEILANNAGYFIQKVDTYYLEPGIYFMVIKDDSKGASAKTKFTVGNGQRNILDDFSNTDSGWLISSEEGGGSDYVAGTFHVWLKNKQKAGALAFNEKLGQYDNFIVSVDANITKDTSGNYANGIVFRAVNTGLYELVLSDDRYYRLVKSVDGIVTSLVDWTQSDYIYKENVSNRLKVVCRGSEIRVYFNHHLASKINDNSLKKGIFGLAASTGSTSPYITEAIFSNFRITVP